MYRSCAQIPSSTGFTAINHCRLQSISPPQSSTAAQPRPDKIKLCTRGKASRRRNPTVACYLGRGDLAEPSHLASETRRRLPQESGLAQTAGKHQHRNIFLRAFAGPNTLLSLLLTSWMGPGKNVCLRPILPSFLKHSPQELSNSRQIGKSYFLAIPTRKGAMLYLMECLSHVLLF
ncbi:hypothetical protein M3J09_005372 [Ascochyta lentis]